MVGRLKEKENNRRLKNTFCYPFHRTQSMASFYVPLSSSMTESKLLVLKYNLGQKITFYFWFIKN